MPVVFAAPFASVFVAVAVMLLAWALTVLLQRPLVYLLERIPLVGYSIGEAVGGAIGLVINWALDWAKVAVDPLVQLVAVPVRAVVAFVSMVTSTLETVAQAIVRVAQVAAGEVGDVAFRLASLIAQVTGIASLLAAVRVSLGALVAKVAAIIAHTIPAAIAAVRAWATALVASARAAITAVLTAAITAVRTWTLGLIAAARLAWTAAIALARAGILATVALLVQPLRVAIDALGRALTATIAPVLARLGILERLLPLALLLPLVQAIPRTIDEFWRTKRGCVDPTCNLLGSTLNGLGAVGELLTGSVLLALVASAINDPEGTAHGIAAESDTFHDLAGEVTTVLAGRRL